MKPLHLLRISFLVLNLGVAGLASLETVALVLIGLALALGASRRLRWSISIWVALYLGFFAFRYCEGNSERFQDLVTQMSILVLMLVGIGAMGRGIARSAKKTC